MSVLEFISSLKWPIVLLVMLAVLVRGIKRNPEFGEWLRNWLDRRDVSAKFGGLAEVQASSKNAVEQAAAVSAASDYELTAIAAEAEPQRVMDPELMGYDPAELRREVVEDLMRTSAQWGWEMAQMGFRTPPDPHIEWSDSGTPHILFGSGSGGGITRTVVVGEDGVLNAAEVNRRSRVAMQRAIRDRMDRHAADGGVE